MARPVWNFSIRTKTSALRCAEERRLARNDCTDQSGLPGLVFYDKDGDAHVLLNLGKDESPGLWFYNKDRIRAAISLAGDQMRLQMFDKENRVRTSVQVDQAGTASMRLYDKIEKAVWQAP